MMNPTSLKKMVKHARGYAARRNARGNRLYRDVNRVNPLIGRRIASNPPSTASSTGKTGTITWDSDYFYVCVATDTWKRVALSTW